MQFNPSTNAQHFAVNHPLVGIGLAMAGLLKGIFRPHRASIEKATVRSFTEINPTGEALTPGRLVAFRGLSHLTQEQAEHITHTIRQLARLIHRTANPTAI
jgi:hypothetical protein